MWPRIFGNPARSLGNASGSGITDLLKILFTTDDASPLTNPYAGEIGFVVPVATDGTLAVASGVLTNTAQATPVEGDLGVYSSTKIPRVAGYGLYCKLTMGTLNTYPVIFWGVNLNASSVGAEAAVRIENPLAVNDGGYFSLGRTLVTGTAYEVWLILKSTGAELFMKGGVFTDWSRRWRFNTGSTAELVAAIGYYNGVADVDSLQVKNIPSFSGDVEVTTGTFTQSLGSELFTNGNFSAWSPANTPTGWVEYNESAGVRDLTEVAPGNLHGGGGSGALNIFSSSGATGVSQTVATTGDLYEMLVDVTAYGSTGVNIYFGGSDGVLASLTAVGSYRMIGRSNSGGSACPGYMGGAGGVTIDNTSFKEITRNTPLVVSNHSMAELTFALPASPKSRDEIYLFYRMPAADDEFVNGWAMCLSRNVANTQWDLTVYSWSTTTRTTRLSTVTNVGNVTTMRVCYDGSNHDWWTLVGTTWTKRGTTVSNAAFNTGTYVNSVYSSGFTPSSLKVYKNDMSAYNATLTP